MLRILFIYLFAALSLATAAQPFSKQELQFVDSLMNANYKPSGPGAVLLIAKNGKAVFRKGYGMANLELSIRNKPEYVFEIGSMSKQFTAVCILKLAQEGKLDIRDEITKYLPAFNTHGRHITIENLLGHTSGIADFFEKKDFITKAREDQSKEDLLNYVMKDSLVFEPGTDWAYSNSGYIVAGLIVEKVSGISLTDYLQQNIFDPLGMSHTSVWKNDIVIAGAANGYLTAANSKFQPAKYLSYTWTFAAGGIISNIDDLLKWDNALYTEKILKQEWLQKAWKSQVLTNGQLTNYGFGWTSNTFNGLQFIEHAGGINGFASDGIRIPSQQLYIVILSNINPPWPPFISSRIALRLSRQTTAIGSGKYTGKELIRDYSGVYAIHHSFFAASSATVEQTYQYFTTKNDTLFLQSPGYGKGPILYVSKDLFVANYTPQYYKFHRNEKGDVSSVEIYNEPIQTGPHEIQLKTNIPLPKEKQAITLDAKKLEALKGKYDFSGGLILPVTIEGNKLFFAMPGQDKEEFFAENETNFFSKKTDITFEFTVDNGKIAGMVVKVQGATYTGRKIE